MKIVRFLCENSFFLLKKITKYNFSEHSKTSIKHKITFYAICLIFPLSCSLASFSKNKYKSIIYNNYCIYRVKCGDTLSRLAQLQGTDIKKLAITNHIHPPYKLRSGQLIKLPGTKKVLCESLEESIHKGGSQKYGVTVKCKHKNNKQQRMKDLLSRKKIHWVWPLKRKYKKKVIDTFNQADIAGQGIVIQAIPGVGIDAAASGIVMYAGEDISGYGKLIIVKHNRHYLSVYANNRKTLVHKGYLVKAGQKIAETGSTGTQEPKLHFEIRYNGKPVDPLHYLPKR